MKNILKKSLSLILAVVIMITVMPTAFAIETQQINEEAPLTDEQIAEIQQANLEIDEYIASLPVPLQMLRVAPKSANLNVSLIQQQNTYYCGPASALMLAKFLNIVDSSYTQGQMATLIGTTSEGSNSTQIANVLNQLLQAAKKTPRYGVANTATSSLSDGIIYTIDYGMPMMCAVKQMPLYTSGGHFIVIKGYDAVLKAGNYDVVNVMINDCHYNNAYYGSFTYSLAQMTTAINSNAGMFLIKTK